LPFTPFKKIKNKKYLGINKCAQLHKIFIINQIAINIWKLVLLNCLFKNESIIESLNLGKGKTLPSVLKIQN
jgi:hypothetical protein